MFTEGSQTTNARYDNKEIIISRAINLLGPGGVLKGSLGRGVPWPCLRKIVKLYTHPVKRQIPT